MEVKGLRWIDGNGCIHHREHPEQASDGKLGALEKEIKEAAANSAGLKFKMEAAGGTTLFDSQEATSCWDLVSVEKEFGTITRNRMPCAEPPTRAVCIYGICRSDATLRWLRLRSRRGEYRHGQRTTRQSRHTGSSQ